MSDLKIPKGIVSYYSYTIEEYLKKYIKEHKKEKDLIIKGLINLIYSIEIQVLKRAKDKVYCITNINTDINIIHVKIFSLNVDEIIKHNKSTIQEDITIIFKMLEFNKYLIKFINSFNSYYDNNYNIDKTNFINLIKSKINYWKQFYKSIKK